MAGWSDDAVRFHGDAVSRVVGPWTHPGPEGPAGRVVVVSGTAGSGRTTVLNQAADDLRRARIRVLRLSGRGGMLHKVAGAPGPAEHVVQGGKVLAAALQVMGAGPAGNLIALAAELATTHLMTDRPDLAKIPNAPDLQALWVEEALGWHAAQQPVGIVIDDADQLSSPEIWWDVLLGTIVPRLATEVPVLVVLGVERSTPAAGSYALRAVDSRLMRDGVADEVRLGPLDRERIRRSLWPIDDDLVDHLRSLVQGRPAWLDELWRAWRAQDVVEWRNGRWAVAPDARGRVRSPLRSRVDLALRRAVPDADAYDRARDLVRTAALEGQRFTAEALAAVLDEDVEDLIEWIDDHLAGPDGLVEDDGFVERAEGVNPPELRCYRFQSALVAGVLRQDVLAETNGKTLARRYAHALAAVYWWSPASRSAWTIARLATAAGDDELVETTWRRANRLQGVTTAAALGRILVARLDARALKPGESLVTAQRLVDIAELLDENWDLAETLRIARAAERGARALLTEGAGTGPTDLLLKALHVVGSAAMDLRLLDDAIAALKEAVELSTAQTDYIRTAVFHRRLANAYRLKSSVDEDALSRARWHLEAGLSCARRTDSVTARMEQGGCLDGLAALSVNAEQQSRAAAQLAEAVTILHGPEFRDHLVSAGVLVGDYLETASELTHSRGHLTDEARFRSAMLRCPRSPSVHCIRLTSLSDTFWALGDIDNAVFTAAQALRLAQEIRSPSEGSALLRLAMYAKSDGSSFTASFVALTASRIDPASEIGQFFREFFPSSILKDTDDATRHGIEEGYCADRGVTLLRDAFGIDAGQVDAMNERLGTATESDLRKFLADVQWYCTQ